MHTGRTAHQTHTPRLSCRKLCRSKAAAGGQARTVIWVAVGGAKVMTLKRSSFSSAYLRVLRKVAHCGPGNQFRLSCSRDGCQGRR